MIYKIFFCISVILVMITNGYMEPVYAAPYVSDCLENNADCTGLDKSTKTNKEDVSEVPAAAKKNGSLLFSFVKMIFALLFVLALIYFLVKFLNKRNKLFSQVKALENIGGISVGPSKSIQIIRIGNKYYLIGVGDNVEMLQEITDEETVNNLLNGKQTNEQLNGSFLSALLPDKRNEKNSSKETNFNQLFSAELDKLKTERKKMIHQHKKEDQHE